MNYVELTNETGPTLLVTEEGDYKLIVTDVLENKTEEDEINISFFAYAGNGDMLLEIIGKIFVVRSHIYIYKQSLWLKV